MRVEITVAGGLGQLAVEAVGLEGAALMPITRITLREDLLQTVLACLSNARVPVLGVAPVRPG